MKRKKQNHELITNIVIGEMAAEGKCVTRHNEKVVFVENAAPGDVVDIKIKKSKKNFSIAEVVNFHQYSDKRVEAFCEHFGSCGGCKWQHIHYETQLFYKTKQVKDNFERIAKIPIPKLLPTIPAPQHSYYRNKLEFTFSNYRWLTKAEIDSQIDIERNALGFHVPEFFDRIIDIKHCYLQQSPSNEIRIALKEFAILNQLQFFDVRKQIGLLRNLIIRTSATTTDIMVIVQFGQNQPEQIALVMDFLVTSFPHISSLQYIINTKGNETFHDLEVVCYKGQQYITELMGEIQFRIGPKSFYQTNSAQAHKLYEIAKSFANLSGKELVYDLYTGTGTIANFIAKNVKKVVGIEYVKEAIEDAKVNAQINNITNSSFFAGDMKDMLSNDFVNQNGIPDIIITDPPRAGMHEDVLKMILDLEVPKIVYISCNPATQARDAAILYQKYDVIALQPVDMFPHTHHIETVMLMQLRNI